MDVSSLVKSLRKEIGCESFLTSKYTEVSHFIDTGSYALNRIMSGDMIHGGIPAGKVVVLAGEKSTGKSLISAQIAVNALNKNKYDLVVMFDSEGGILKQFFKSQGADMSKIEYVLVSTIEECSTKMQQFFDSVEPFKKAHPKFKCLVIMDSLGAMVGKKTREDAINKGKQTGDQGLRAKSMNTFVKALTVPALKTDIPVVLLNHVYCDPNSMYPSKIKSQSGGEGIQYMGSITIQCARTLVKTKGKEKGGDDDDDTEDIIPEADATNDESFYKGSWLSFFTVKNRIVKPFYDAKVYVDFSKGLAKYEGLFDLAVKYGCITVPSKGWYEVPSYKPGEKMRRSEISKPEIWESFIKDLNEKARKDICYCEGESPDDEQYKIPGVDEDGPKEEAKTE